MLVERSEGLIKEAIQKINSFFDTKWKAYRKQAEETPIKLFKDYHPFSYFECWMLKLNETARTGSSCIFYFTLIESDFLRYIDKGTFVHI